MVLCILIRYGTKKYIYFIKNINLILTWNPSIRHKYHGGTSLTLYNSFFDWLSLMTSNESSCCTAPSLPFTCTCMPWSLWSHFISSVVERNLGKQRSLLNFDAIFWCLYYFEEVKSAFQKSWRSKQETD